MEYADRAIQTAMKYDISPVMERYAEDTRLPPEALAEHEREIKRFLALSSQNPGKYGMRGPLDELWHTFIMFTSKYADFCRELGGGFIHHLPADPKRRDEPQPGVKSGYLLFLEDYREVFNEEAPAHLWPGPIGNGDVMDPSCDQCGIWCSQTCAAIEIMPAVERF